MSDLRRPLTCDDADPLLAAWAVGGVSPGEHRALRRHLAACADCRQLGAAYLRAADVLPLGVEVVEPPPGLRSRLLAAVHAEASSGAPAAGGRRWRRLWARVPSGRAFTVAGALSTAGAVAAVAVLLATRQGSTTREVSACGLGSAPAACGTLEFDAADSAGVLTVTGLPAVSTSGGRPDATYEAWLIRSDGRVVPAAYLAQSPDGRTYTAAMTGDMSQVSAVALTREPFGGSPTPTGPELLHLDVSALR